MNAQVEQTNRHYISSEVRFYSITDIMEMTGWGERAVQNMFKDPDFPAVDFGKTKIVEAHALIDYFSVRRTKENEQHWMRGELSDELKKRVG